MREIARAALASALHPLHSVKLGHRITDSRLAAWLCGEGAVVAKLRCGAQAIVFANDYMGRAMYLWGEHDPRISAVIRAALRKGDTVIDIGANFGVTGLVAAHCVGREGAVHLFEPQPIVASCLRTSLLINGYSQAVLHECALSDQAGFADMTVVDPSNWGMTTLASADEIPGTPANTIRVRMEKAGEYMASLECNRVALLKIDVEGHEAVILASMRDWLAQMRPPVILFECYHGESGFHQEETIRLLSELGYAFLGFDMKPYWRTKLYVVNETQHPVGHDFVAIQWQGLDEDRRKSLQAMMV
jgi:FkbM family methyltransferase